MSKKIDWYFDFISPFVYLQHHRLCSAHSDIRINYRPVIFGALLGEHGHKGPAEIESKRIMTYRYCHWYAKQHNIPFMFPETHPFRPVAILRLALAAKCDPEAIRKIFEFIWIQGLNPSSPDNFNQLAGELGIKNAGEAVQDEAVKQQLRNNTEEALRIGVFGVPTIAIGEKLFWGDDLTEMAMQYLDDPDMFENQDYKRLEAIPNGLA